MSYIEATINGHKVIVESGVYGANSSFSTREWFDRDPAERVVVRAGHQHFDRAARLFVNPASGTGLTEPKNSRRGDDPDSDAAWDAYNAALRTPRVAEVADGLKELGITLPDAENLTWHLYAGCTLCPCSPGLLTPDQLAAADGTIIDTIYIDYYCTATSKSRT